MEELIARLKQEFCGNYYVISGNYNDLRAIMPLLVESNIKAYFIDCSIIVRL